MVFQALGLDVLHEAIGEHGGAGCNLSSMDKGAYGNALVVHQVREPRAVAGSLRAVPYASWEAYQAMAIRTGMVWRPLSEPLLKNGMTIWLNFNNRMESTTEFTYRVENLEAELPRILNLLDLPDMPMPDISRTTNSHSQRPKPTWDELYALDADLAEKVRTKAVQYGYKY